MSSTRSTTTRSTALPTVRARFQNVYGPGEVLGAGEWRGTPATVWRNVTPTFIYRALKGLPLTLDNGGVASRDFIYVDDVARGFFACATNGAPGDVYNIASGVETTIRRARGAGHRAQRQRLGARARTATPVGSLGSPLRQPGEGGARDSASRPTVDLEEGLRRTIDWTRENLAFIEAMHRRSTRTRWSRRLPQYARAS